MCGATGGWPGSYCGSGTYAGSFCDDYKCNYDCVSLRYAGGYCDGKCYCWRQVPVYAPAETGGPIVQSDRTATGEQPTVVVEDAEDDEQSPEYGDSN